MRRPHGTGDEGTDAGKESNDIITTMNTTQKNITVTMTGFAGLIFLSDFVAEIVLSNFLYGEVKDIMYLLAPIFSIATPILFGWIGILLRQKWQFPRKWVQVVLASAVPAIYIMWTVLHINGIHFFMDGERCLWLFIGILFYLIPPRLLDRYKNESGLFELLLFVGAAFCYVGITRVTNHFSVANFQMLTGEWTRLFCRLMRFVPLAMGIYFLAAFAFSKTGQKIGNSKDVVILTKILLCISFLVSAANLFRYGFHLNLRWFFLYKVLSQPVAIYLLVAAYRALKRFANRTLWMPRKGRRDECR